MYDWGGGGGGGGTFRAATAAWDEDEDGHFWTVMSYVINIKISRESQKEMENLTFGHL